jgi:four helix bundle protein
LKVFQLADALVVEVYTVTATFPREERYGLTAQIRSAAVSVPTNLVEGSARSGEREYLHFITISLGSACELRYLLGLSTRLQMLEEAKWEALSPKCDSLVRGLDALVASLSRHDH